MKVCPHCNKENPSAAIHCMFCGILLVEEVNLSEEEKLRLKLKETEKENQLLKDALEAQLKDTGISNGEQNKTLKSNDVVEQNETQQTKICLEEAQQTVKGNVKSSSSTMLGIRLFFSEYWVLLLIFMGVPCLITVLSNRQIVGRPMGIVLEESPIFQEKNMEEESVEERVKSFIQKYSELTETGDTALLFDLYAPHIERYHDVYNIDVNYVADKYANYDNKFGVYGKHSSIRWNTLSYEKVGDITIVQCVEDYTVDRYDNSKYSIFVLEKHFELDREYRILSVYDVQLSKSKKSGLDKGQKKSLSKQQPKAEPIPIAPAPIIKKDNEESIMLNR